MSERFTKRKENGGVQFSNGEYWNTVYPKNENCLTDIHRMAIKLCDLEDKIEQGKIVELPCRAGQTVYAIARWNGEYVIRDVEVCNYTIFDNEWKVVDPYGDYWSVNNFGKTVFLDRATAEAKLREMEGERE